MKIEKYYTSFTQVPLEIWRDEDLTLPQKSIMNFVWSITAYRDDNKAIIQSKILEEITGLDRSNVYRNTKSLEEMGYFSKKTVKTEHSLYKVTEYTLNLPYLLSKYEKKGMRVKLSTDNEEKQEKNEKNVKKVEKTLDKTTPKLYTYKSEEEKMAETKSFIEKRLKEIENCPYRKKEN